jgi:hypothetical protein
MSEFELREPLVPMSEDLRAICLETYDECLQQISSSIERKTTPAPESAELLAVLLAAAQTCQSTASLIQLKSANLDKILTACIEICELCADACSRAELKMCQDACQRCADACRNYRRS